MEVLAGEAEDDGKDKATAMGRKGGAAGKELESAPLVPVKIKRQCFVVFRVSPV